MSCFSGWLLGERDALVPGVLGCCRACHYDSSQSTCASVRGERTVNGGWAVSIPPEKQIHPGLGGRGRTALAYVSESRAGLDSGPGGQRAQSSFCLSSGFLHSVDHKSQNGGFSLGRVISRGRR